LGSGFVFGLEFGFGFWLWWGSGYLFWFGGDCGWSSGDAFDPLLAGGVTVDVGTGAVWSLARSSLSGFPRLPQAASAT
jgi:hypothetical protein